MTTGSTAKPTACVVHYEIENDEEAKFKELWTQRELLEMERKERDYLKVHFPNCSNLSQSWDERLTTRHRYSSLRPPQHPPIPPTKDISSWPNSRQLNTRQILPSRSFPRTAPDLSSSISLSRSLGAGPGDTSLTSNAEMLDNPSWNFHLNAWVSSKLGQSNTYISLAGQTELFDRGIYNCLPEFQEGPILPCPRYLHHMHKQTVLKPIEPGKTKKVLEKPKFWKWKGKTKQPVTGDEVKNDEVNSPSLPPIPSVSQETSLPATPSASSFSNHADSSSESSSSSSSSMPVSFLTSSPTSSPHHPSGAKSLPGSCIGPRHPPCNSPALLSKSASPASVTSLLSKPEHLTKSDSSSSGLSHIELQIPARVFQTECTDGGHALPLQGHVAAFLTPTLTPWPSPQLSSPHGSYNPSPSLLPSVGPLTPQSSMSPEMKRDGNEGDKPPIEFYHLTDPPKTASSMDWEIAGNLGDVESSDEDDIVLGVSPSQLKRLFFSNDYIEVMEVPTFGHVEYASYNLYKGVVLMPGLEITAEQDTAIQPPDKLIVNDVITLHSPPPAPIPVPVMPSLPPPKEPTPPPPIPTPPPTKDPTPTPPPISKPKRKPIVKKKKFQPVAKIKKAKPLQENALPGVTSLDSSTNPVESTPVEPLPDVKEEEEPAPMHIPILPPPAKTLAPTITKKDRPRPRPAPPRLKTPSPLRADTHSSGIGDSPSSKTSVDVTQSAAKTLLATPALTVQSPDPVAAIDEETTQESQEGDESGATPLPPPVKDAAFAAQQERERLAEERRQKAYDMFERLKDKRFLPKNLTRRTTFKEAAKNKVQGYQGWLAQFFIINEDKSKMYRQVFSTVDEDDDGYLSCFETLMALKGISGAQKLTEKEESYIVRVLELAEYSISQGTDFKLFSVLAALSQKIVSIDTWVRNLINSMDLTTLEWKITKAKELFEWCVEEDSRSLRLEKLLVELKAGGVSENHQEEVRLTVGSKESWDLIDFLSYLPLFIMTHESVVNNPLDDSRSK
ncbi:uncharacterized protein [Apostichopus japonicus]|uniref:uncharacterized protein isoform X2 n=1 Tax=Stichopus japonicus TaxID=307972 RepID=UPI003AB41B0C